MSDFFHPVPGTVLPRFAGLPSFMRLPYLTSDHARLSEVDVGFYGMPWDGGTSNRPGARHGPRALRDASTMIRAQHAVTNVRPFEAMNCADLGDVSVNPVEQDSTLAEITRFVGEMMGRGTKPFGVAGDHLCTLPVLRAVAASGTTPALLLYDSHTDLFPPYFGSPVLTHGNPFRMAVEEGLIDCERSVMIGMRGTMYDDDDRRFGAEHGITIIPMHEAFEGGLVATVQRAKSIIGDAPTYFSFDIDFIDPAFAPGTGTPEVGGPTSAQTLDMIRAADGIDFIGMDLVEVSPPFDNNGITSWLGVSVMFEMLCLMKK
ncbi:MAG: agmatinase [Pseudomonadota bacterium]